MTEAFREVFSSVLGIEASSLVADSSPETIATWDSITHITLMLAIEAEYGIQFDPMDLMELHTAGEIYDRVLSISGT